MLCRILSPLVPKNSRLVLSGRRTYIKTFAPDDFVIIRDVKDRQKSFFAGPLKADLVIPSDNDTLPPTQEDDSVPISRPRNKVIRTNRGNVAHVSIIGKRPRSIVQSDSGAEFMVHHSTFEEYIMQMFRNAQPIYPYDAMAIAALADLYPPRLEDVNIEQEKSLDGIRRPLQVLEAGTGHGSLSLAICRAIHSEHNCSETTRVSKLISIDWNPKHSKIGKDNVCRFGRGIYTNDAEFVHSITPTEWLEQKTIQEPFLTTAFLDMPDPEFELHAIEKALLPDGLLIIFTPSITQIVNLQAYIRKARDSDNPISLVLERVAEIASGSKFGGGGMREWDLRMATTRKSDEPVWICRPKVFERIVGGGFIVVFKKWAEIKKTNDGEDGNNNDNDNNDQSP